MDVHVPLFSLSPGGELSGFYTFSQSCRATHGTDNQSPLFSRSVYWDAGTLGTNSASLSSPSLSSEEAAGLWAFFQSRRTRWAGDIHRGCWKPCQLLKSSLAAKIRAGWYVLCCLLRAPLAAEILAGCCSPYQLLGLCQLLPSLLAVVIHTGYCGACWLLRATYPPSLLLATLRHSNCAGSFSSLCNERLEQFFWVAPWRSGDIGFTFLALPVLHGRNHMLKGSLSHWPVLTWGRGRHR